MSEFGAREIVDLVVRCGWQEEEVLDMTPARAVELIILDHHLTLAQYDDEPVRLHTEHVPTARRGVDHRMTLTDFLLARIDEDEAAALSDRSSTRRLRLAICKVQRRQLVRCSGRTEPVAKRALLDLALPYASHADYREEWRP